MMYTTEDTEATSAATMCHIIDNNLNKQKKGLSKNVRTKVPMILFLKKFQEQDGTCKSFESGSEAL